MPRQVLFYILLCLPLLVYVIGGCARVVPPTGGPKDSLAPVLVRAVPAVGSLNFRGKVVVLEFSEPVQLNNLNQQLIVSPVQDNPFVYKLRGKRLDITFSKPFPDSSTVYLNFRAAVQDLTEKNQVADLRIAFATGPELDTLSMAGSVADLFTGLPVDNAQVGLYPVTDTTNIARQRPQYLTLTDKKGAYRLENLRRGTYVVAAFADRNGNARWSGKAEPVAFLDSTLELKADTAVAFLLSTIDDQAPRLTRVQARAGAVIEVGLSEGLTRLIALAGADTLPRQPIDRGGAVYGVYMQKPFADTLMLHLIAIDSAGQRLDTLARVSPYKPPRNAKADTVATRPFKVAEEPARGTALAPGAEVRLGLPEPARPGSLPSPLALQTDSQKTRTPIVGKFNTYRNAWLLAAPQASSAFRHVLYLPAGALVTAQGSPNQADTLRYPVLSDEAVGLIRGEVVNSAPHTVLQLLSDQGAVLRTLKDAKRFEFTYLPPANYLLRLVIDLNANGVWDAGSYRNRRRPEPIIPPGPPIQVKANWEVEGIVVGQ